MCTSNENDRRVARKNSTVLAAHDNGYDSTSCCISQMPKYGKGRVSTTHSGKTTGPILINLDMQNYTPEATRHANFDFDPETSVVWANASLPLSFFSFLCQAHRSHCTSDLHQICTRRSAQENSFWRSKRCATKFSGSTPQKTNFE